MYVDTATSHVETGTAAGLSEPILRARWPSGTRRVFWAIEPGKEVHPAEPRKSNAPSGLIEITLGDGIRVRVDNDVDGTALRRVLEALQAHPPT